MRYFLFTVAFALLYGSARTQPADCIQKANRLLDEAFTLMQQHYYRKDSVAWTDLAKAARERLNTSANCEAAHETLQWCFRQMKERHSFIMPAVKADVYNGNINSSKDTSLTSPLIGPFRYELVEAGIAYIDIPWISTADKKLCNAFADSLHRVIADYHRSGINKWIIDLRNNTGGNCWPMLAGLGALLGNGVHGYFVSASEKIPISYQDGAMKQGRYARCTVTEPYLITGERPAIVVLTGPNTASAGEIVALAFKGKEGVQLFGEPTAGLTTANATYKLSDGSMLVLTVCREADRNGNIQEGRIHPDRPVTPYPGKDIARVSALMFLQLD
jgi:carboxyl-terminal processing protease